ncbi:MAG: YHS domain-containing (seleno)protein [Azospirillaceae bacterium]
MRTFNTLIAAAALVGVITGTPAAMADDEYNVSTGTTVSGAGVALRGVDAVALATGLEVAPGRAVFTVEHDGVAYYFASEQSMALFSEDPDRYLPQFGGFCAYGVANGLKLDANPHFADIVDGQLYLFLNEVAFERYLEDPAGTIALAEENWPGMHHRAVEDVNGLETASR